MADTADQIATAAELATWMGAEFDDDDTARAELILRLASYWARDIALTFWPDRSEVPFTARGIVLAASRREFENPRKVVYEVKGPESASYNQQAYPPGFFTDPELKFLKRYTPGGGLFSLTTCRDDDEWTLGYIRVLGSDSRPIPYFNPWDPGWEEAEHL